MINKDPFGGVSSELEPNSPSPFKIDKEEALKQIQKSMELWDKKKIKKKSFLQKLREKNKSDIIVKHLTGNIQKNLVTMLMFTFYGQRQL